MRTTILILFLLPIISQAQVNRSANELARENVKDYVLLKIFRNENYQPVSYTVLKPIKQEHSPIVWSINHTFHIIDSQFVANKKIAVAQPYLFSFYLDKRLNVVLAEGFSAK